ncbi:MAG TPA: xanthine dehydrogenase family protein molybdopterin-binding subunit [Nitrososphaerales archaeon]|nr:xanthine dehydrogenase family protein molybdopterin-binding subunit [Nitrososphaerales archaeon]
MSRTIQIESEKERGMIGKAIKTKEDSRFIRGNGRYVDDVRLPNICYAMILRSPYPHAKIRRIDFSKALSIPGVIDVLSSQDVVRMSDPLSQMTVPPASNVKDYPIAVEKARYVGEPIAVVVAESRYIAEDALEEIDVEYELIEPVTDARKALSSSEILVHETIGTNVMGHIKYEYGNIDKAMSEADRVLEANIHFHRFSSTPLEPNAVIADFNQRDDSLTVWCNNQEPSFMLPQFNSSLRLPYDKMRFITLDIGGGFGCKITNYAYVILISLASMKIKRPVNWLESRSEHLAAGNHGAERLFEVKVPVKNDGTVLGLKIKSIDDDGAFARHEPAGLTVWAQVVPGAYKIRNVSNDMYAVFTNKCPAGPNRGFARAPHSFMIERVMDLVAKELKLDVTEVRNRNYIRREDQPYTTPNGCVYDDGDYPKSLEMVLDALDYVDWRKKQKDLLREGKHIGIGIATTLDSGAPNFGQVKMLNPKLPLIGNTEACLLQLTADGRFVVKLGTVPQGQSHETVTSQIIADVFGVSTDVVNVATGFDSASHPYTMHSGTYGSRYAAMGGGAAYGAALKLRQKVIQIGAHLLGVDNSQVELIDGNIVSKTEPSKNISLKRLARTAYGMPALLPRGMDAGLWTINVYFNGLQAPDERKIANLALTYSYQTHGLVGELDAETGKFRILRYIIVDDAGRMINPLVVDGQVHGAALHGIAAALYEDYKYNDEGQLEASTFVDYLAPAAVDVPSLEVSHLEIPSPFAPLGAKGVGEGGGTAHVAVINAINDALIPFEGVLEKSIAYPEAVLNLVKSHGRPVL